MEKQKYKSKPTQFFVDSVMSRYNLENISQDELNILFQKYDDMISQEEHSLEHRSIREKLEEIKSITSFYEYYLKILGNQIPNKYKIQNVLSYYRDYLLFLKSQQENSLNKLSDIKNFSYIIKKLRIKWNLN